MTNIIILDKHIFLLEQTLDVSELTDIYVGKQHHVFKLVSFAVFALILLYNFVMILPLLLILLRSAWRRKGQG